MEAVKCATKAFIMDGDRVLVLKSMFEGKEYCDMPGGKMEFGLTPEDNLRRK